jgi:hypothetical protein
MLPGTALQACTFVLQAAVWGLGQRGLGLLGVVPLQVRYVPPDCWSGDQGLGSAVRPALSELGPVVFCPLADLSC